MSNVYHSSLRTQKIKNVESRSILYSILGSLIVIILGFFYITSRVGLSEKHISEVFVFAGFSFLVLNLPEELSRQIRKRQSVPSIWMNELLLTIYLFGVLIILSYASLPFVDWVIFSLGVLCLIRNCRAYISTIDLSFVFYLLAVSLFGLWIAGVCWKGDYLSPLFLESIEMSEKNGSSLDPLFHMSIAQMLKHYNTVSNGLHGLSYVKYHFLSHFLMARISFLADTHLLYVYNIGQVLVFAPLMFKAFLVVVDSSRVAFNIPLKYNKLIFTLVLLGLTSFMPQYIFDNLNVRAAIGFNSLFISESYLLSIILLLVAIHTVMNTPTSGRHFNLFLFIFLPLSLALITLAKVSTGFLVMVALGFLFIRLKHYKELRAWIALLLLSSIAGSIAYLISDEHAADSEIQWMSFFITEVKTKFRYFLPLFYFWVLGAGALLLTLLIFRKKNISSNLKKARVAFEVILVVAVAGFLPPAMLRILGGSGIYFLEPQRWFAVLLLATLLPLFFDLLKVPRRYLRLLQVCMLAVLGFNSLVYLSKAIKHNFLCRTFYINPSVAESLKDVDSESLSRIKNIKNELLKPSLIDSFNVKLNNSPIYAALNGLMKMDDIPKQRNLIYIKDYALFHERLSCYHYFYAVPALSGFAAYQGLDYWCVGEGYFLDEGKVTRSRYNPEEFCGEIKDWGLNGYYTHDLDLNKSELVQCQ